MFRLVSLVFRVTAIAAAVSVGAGADGPSAWYEGFEGPHPTWRDAGGNARHRVELHQRVQGQAHTGNGCEWLRISAANGEYVYFAHDIGHPRVIDELMPSVWVKSDRAGLQFLVRAVLPRAKDPRTGRPLSTLLPGSMYTASGRWQQLRVDNIPQLLRRQARLLQPQRSNDMDVREAYLDLAVLNVYGGPGVTNVLVDDLDVAGYIDARVIPGGPAGSEPASPPVDSRAGTAVPAAAALSDEPGHTSAGTSNSPKLSGSTLLIDGHPFFPRAIQYQGEPLAELERLGFNTIWMSQQPSSELLADARQRGMWLIGPPPLAPAAQAPAADVSIPVVGPGFDRVLAWDLGAGLREAAVDEVREWSERIRAADRHNGRPLVCRPDAQLAAYSRVADLLLIGRWPLGSSLEMADYGTWVRERPRLACPGTPIWSTVQTQPARTLIDQLAILGRGEPPPTTVPSEQIRLLAYAAVAAGSRGLLFESQSPLNADDPDTRIRAATLELLNLELSLIEPWAAAGQFMAMVTSRKPELTAVTAAVLRTDRARLLIPMWSGRGAQFVAGQSTRRNISLIVPGAPDACSAYELVPGGLKTLFHERVTGGVLVTLDDFGLTSLVMLTQDPLAITRLRRRTEQIGPRAAALERELAAAKLRTAERVHGALTARSAPLPQAAQWLAAARESLQASESRLAARDDAGAYRSAQVAERSLRLLERAHWESAAGGLRSPVASPAAVFFATLPWHRAMMDFVATARPEPNRLAGGDFEDLGALLQAGWQLFRHLPPRVAAESNLSPAAAHNGRYGLRLSARATEPNAQSLLLESPPVSVETPPIQFPAGGLICIRGWAHVPAAITGSVDGLMITDSLGGEALAERIDTTVGWTPFALYRVVPPSGQVKITFALTGLGEAWIDDVSVQLLQPPASAGVNP